MAPPPLLLPLLVLLSLAPLCLAVAPCPRSCTCPQPTELHCTFRSLPSVPHNINRRVERVNLGFNRISQLSEKSLSGLTRLEMLLIHSNELHSVPDGAFKDLAALQMLKLSYNQLREVSRHTFVGLWSLARLHLDHNGLESIDPDAFHGLTSLRLLQLEGNRIKRLHGSTFTTFTVMGRFHLSTLRHLYLSNNSLSAVPEEALQNMPQLENLFLHGNPWVCDCNMKWIRRWLQTAPGVLKCKKDRSLPAGQLCPMCSSPRNLRLKPLQSLDSMVCSRPVIESKDEREQPEETGAEFPFLDDFRRPFGNISLGLSDEHGNAVELECGIGEPRDGGKISFEQVDDATMASNVSLSLDLDCDVDREKYERLWRLIAYYTSVPAHLKRGAVLTKDPHPAYVYKQDSDKDALYYTGVKASIMALPTWLMQTHADLQLNRHGSSAKKVKLILTTQLSEDLDLEMARRQRRTWVTVEEAESLHKMAVVGKAFDLQCNVQSVGEPGVTWILPDGTKLAAPSGNADERLSVSADGRLVFKTAEHKDAGSYYCVAKVEEDVAVLALFVSVQDSSNPQPGESQATPTELLAGNSLNLDCDASGSPDPEVNWIIPNGSIVSFSSNSSRVSVFSNGTLHIPQSLPPDNGFYKCVAMNRYGADTKAAKVTVNRRPGSARPLRRFPMKPQSAAGVNTRVQINDLDEGSGDAEEEEEAGDPKPTRKVVPVRNAAHPSRNSWRRPPIMLRKPNPQITESGKNVLDQRRRVNMAKINPERWADILAKIRVKNGRFLTTASPVITTTAELTTEFKELTTSGQEDIEKYSTPFPLTSLAHEAIEGSSDGGREKAGQDFPTVTTTEPESPHSFPTTSQTFPTLQQATSSNALLFPQTTSAPLQAVTLWQAKPNTRSESPAHSQQEDIERDGGRPGDSKRPRAKGNRKNKTRLSKLKTVKGGRVAPSAVPVTTNGDDRMIFSTHRRKIEDVIGAVSPTTSQIWSKQLTRQQSSRRRNGNRKKKPNRRRNKLNKSGLVGGSVTAVPETDVLGSSEPNVQGLSTSAVNHTSNSSQTGSFTNNRARGFITTAFPETRPSSNSRRRFTSRPLAPVKPLARTPVQSAVADRPSGERRHAKGKLIQSRRGYTAPGGETRLVNGNGEQLASRSSPLVSLTEHKAEEMYHSRDRSELIATTGIDFEVLTATKPPGAGDESSSQNAEPDTIDDVRVIAFTAPPMSLSSPRMFEPEESTSDSSIKSQSESPVPSNTDIPQTTVMFKVTSGKSNENDQQTQDELPTLTPNAITQTPLVHQSQVTPTKSVTLQTEEPSLQTGNPSSAITPMFLNVTTEKTPVTKDSSISPTDSHPNTTSILRYSTQQVPSTSSSWKTVQRDQNIQAKTTDSPHSSALSPEQATSLSSLSISSKVDHNSQAKTTNSPHSSALSPEQATSLSSISISSKVEHNSQAKTTNSPHSSALSPEQATSLSSISISSKVDHNNQAKTTNSPNSVAQSLTLAPILSRNSPEQATSISISSKVDAKVKNSQAKTTNSPHSSTLSPEQATSLSSISISSKVDHNNQAKTTNSPHSVAQSLTLAPILSWNSNEQATSISISYKVDAKIKNSQAKTTNSPHSIAQSSTLAPMLSRNSPEQATSISISSKVDAKVKNSEAKTTNSLHSVAQSSTLAPMLSRNGPEQATSLSISSKVDQNGEANSLQTSVTHQPSLDLVTQSSNPRLNRFISANPTTPAINPRTTPLLPRPTTRSPIPAHPRTERPRARATPKPPPAARPRGKPRITKGNFQTTSVKAETDAVLPCAADGDPEPFLSWTKVSTGTSIPQNTRLQRFEVHQNGTLVIRNTQPLDGGEYLCTVQNQYGSDQALTNLVVLSQHPKILQPRHRDFSVNLGSDIDVDCQVEGHPRPRVSWVLPNHAQIAAAPLGSAPNRVSVLQSGALRIVQAAFSDRGIYKCVGSSTSGADTVSVRLYVSALPPVFKQTPIENVTAAEDGAVFLHCAANGSPQPTIRWTTPDGIQLTSSQYLDGRRTLVFPNGTLFMQSLTQANAGKYQCLASNVLGTSRRTVNLAVRSQMLMAKASITRASAKVTEVVYGGELRLDCVAKGEPQPRVMWRTPSKKLVDSHYSFDPRIRVHPNGSITVLSVTDRDGGDYLCVARNKMGDDYVVLRAQVLTKPAKIEQKTQRSSQEVVYGGDLKVDCVASGLPDPEISWALPDGTMVNTEKQQERAGGGRRRRFVIFDNGTLFFNAVGMREEGDYTCYAENQLGKDQMKVHVRVKATSSPPQILSKASPVRVPYGGNFTLRCDAAGEPTPTFTWISPMNRVILPNKDKYQVLDDGALVVLKAQRFDAGDYTCTARNAAGQDGKVVKVDVLVLPPVISNTQGSFSVVQSERVWLDCAARGTPAPRVMWVLPGNVILPAPYHSTRMTVHQNGTLEIRSARMSDAGELACVARNEGGEARLAVSLHVTEANARTPDPGSQTETVSLTAGNAMALSCGFDGSVTWVLPNGAPLQSGARFMKFYHRQDGSLVISNPTLAEAGTYRCLGRDDGVQVEQVVQLAPGRKPEIVNRYNSSISIMHGETLTLHCATNGEPPRLTWTLPSGVVLNRPQKAGRYSVLPNGTLAIQQISVYDRGAYVCRAANEYGSSGMSASVIVIAYPPRITNWPSAAANVKQGEAIQLNCAATGIPSVEVAWETPDKTRLVVSARPRLYGNKYLHPQGSLVIQNPTKRDGGVYRCTARNVLGADSKTTYLYVN